MGEGEGEGGAEEGALRGVGGYIEGEEVEAVGGWLAVERRRAGRVVLWVFGGETELVDEGGSMGGVEVADYYGCAGGVSTRAERRRRGGNPSAANRLSMPSPSPPAPPVMRIVLSLAVAAS